ncbi:unnamed protein product, partial [Closterium sp. NIES-53]
MLNPGNKRLSPSPLPSPLSPIFRIPLNCGLLRHTSVATAYKCAVVLRDVILPYLLRRVKADVDIQLPEKTERVLLVPWLNASSPHLPQLQVATAYKCAVVLRDVILPYLLRRVKADVDIQLPEKTERVLLVPITRFQRTLYRAFLQ